MSMIRDRNLVMIAVTALTAVVIMLIGDDAFAQSHRSQYKKPNANSHYFKKNQNIPEPKFDSAAFEKEFDQNFSAQPQTVVKGNKTTKNSGRAEMLSKLESILSYISNGVLIVGCALGGPVLLFGFIQLAMGAHDGVLKIILGLFGICGGLATPYCINWLFKYACDNNIF